MRRLVLVGLPGTGKTTVARALAERWHCAVLDTDDVVAQSVGTSVAQYLRNEGEALFRSREVDALRTVLGAESATGDVIVATGGGIVTSAEARDLLAQEMTLWLDCVDEVILTRLGDVARPLMDGGADEALRQLRREREGWYREVSRARIDTSSSVDEVVEQVTGEVDRLTR